MELEIAFGQVLRDFRRKKEISQEALALESGLDRTYISLLERGRRQPSLRTLFRLATIFQSSPSELVAEVEKRLSDLE